MTGKEALEFNEELKKIMEKTALELGLEKEIGTKFVDQYVEIYPDENPIMGMVDLKKSGSHTLKPGNILVNQQGFLKECVIFGLNFEIPKTKLELVKLCIFSLIAIYDSSKIELNEYESYIVAYLHHRNMYTNGYEEDKFYQEFSVWYEKNTENKINQKQMKDAIENLITLKTIAMEEGEIRLKEQVWRDRLSQ